MNKFIHHYSAYPRFGEEGDDYSVIETNEGFAIWHRSMPIESDFANEVEASERANKLAEAFDREVMTLDMARDLFDNEPNDLACSLFLNQARIYHRDEMISDDTFHDIVWRVSEWLADDTKLED